MQIRCISKRIQHIWTDKNSPLVSSEPDFLSNKTGNYTSDLSKSQNFLIPVG
jgi:hypothetical protein